MSRSAMEHVSGILRDTVLVARRLGALGCHGSRTLQRALLGRLHDEAGKGRAAVRVAAVVGAFFVVFSTCLFVYMSDEGNGSCPPQPQPTKPDGASSLLALAYQGESGLANRSILQKCMQWEPKQKASPSMEQLRAQLECHSAFVATIADVDDAEAEHIAFVARIRGALAAIKGISQRCAALQSKLYTLSRAGAATRRPTEAIVALSGLAGFEKFARDALSTLKFLNGLREDDISKFGEDDVSHQIPALHVDLRVCMLKAAREARVMVHALPVASPAVQRVEQCKPGLLAGMEGLALAEIDLETNSDVVFRAGMLISEVGMAPSTTPFFGSGRASSSAWTEDTKGFRVPEGIATSEKMLLGSLEVSTAGVHKAELAKACLMRLAKHAKFLAGLNQYAPAEWRYRASVELARSHAPHQMTSSALAQLSYFLSLHGQYEEALKASTDALSLSEEDSLASYLQATLRLSLGELRTAEHVLDAAEQLKAVAGKLPAEHLETSRAGVLAKLEALKGISDSGTFGSCLELGDSAQMLSCVIGRFVYDA